MSVPLFLGVVVYLGGLGQVVVSVSFQIVFLDTQGKSANPSVRPSIYPTTTPSPLTHPSNPPSSPCSRGPPSAP